MNRKTLFNLLTVLFLALGLGGGVQAQGPTPPGGDVAQANPGTSFTYQGRLTDTTGTPIPGPCTLRFTLYGSASGSDQVGMPQTKTGVTLDNGYFAVDLDFGADAFNGDARYIKIEVDGGSGYTPLSPRVKLNPAPYALALPGLRTQQNATSPNVIGGYSGNSVGAVIVGATIGGGGTSGAGNANSVTANYGTVGGGQGNAAVVGQAATVGGGQGNTASAADATVGGGQGNTAGGDRATVGGGQQN
ncbi:MAG: hypothetical protein KKA73_20775, partial [Chloroflexi bacterium]|nr:hypothetical protein [Chloroflexota bacterium]